MISEKLVQDRLDFWGYGSFNAPVWFVGMEEGLPALDAEQLEARFRVTQGRPLVDIRQEMAPVLGHMKWFKEPYPIQATWKYLIALHLCLKDGQRPSRADIALFQGMRFADTAIAATAAIELMPLPSSKAHQSTWLYGSYPGLGLASRSEYLAKYKPSRVRQLRELIGRFLPRLVIFHSVSYVEDWEAVCGISKIAVTRQMYFMQNDYTAFCIIPQASSFGMSYRRLYEYADLIRERISDRPTVC